MGTPDFTKRSNSVVPDRSRSASQYKNKSSYNVINGDEERERILKSAKQFKKLDRQNPILGGDTTGYESPDKQGF